jgi:tRNA modification GTPase
MHTIAALATAGGKGGIAVIRLSGDDSIEIASKVFKPFRMNLCDAQSNLQIYGKIVGSDGNMIDTGLATVFRAPHSFTGEDVVEIACHGSMYIQQTLIQWLVDAGCQMAKAGEFTQRAFLNGKMDLAEAEAVADLIAAQTKAEKDLALAQLRGGISGELAILRERLLTFTSLVELELDFADHEELEFADRTQLQELATEIERKIHTLTSSFKTGNAIKQGIPVAIIGAPNVGKSTLLNALLGEERAIVSDIQGTTRDTIEDTLVLGGMLFRFIDTAGVRQTDDTIENLGIERSLQAAQRATIIIHLQDATNPQDTLAQLDTQDKLVLQVFNKVDLVPSIQLADGVIGISAKHGDISPITSQLIAFANEQYNIRNAATISNARHYEALVRAQEAIQRVQQGLNMQISGEFLSMDLQDCLAALGEITGQITSQEVLNNIFGKFCIGK